METVLVSVGRQLIFFIAVIVKYFGFVIKIALINKCFGYC